MSHGSSNSCGVAILIKKRCSLHSPLQNHRPLGRYIVLKAEIKDKIYVLIISMHQTKIKTVSNSLPIC